MSTRPAIIPPFVAAILKEYTDAIRPAIGFMLISAVFSAFLVPLFFMLLSMSTASSRKRPIFIINTLSILLGLVLGILSIHLSVTGILNPLVQSNAKEVFAYGVFFVWLPWITEFVLIFRVLVVYSSYSRTRLGMIIAFPVVMKLARAGIFIHFLVLWNQLTATSTVQQYLIAEGLPRWIHECGWILELFDNMYISALFLWQLASQGHIFNGQSVGRHSDGGKYSVTNQLRTLFWIASTNLIFPIIFGVIEIAFLFQPQLQLTASMIYSANIYVSVVSTVFASVWASTSPFRDTAALQHDQPAQNGSKREKLEPLAFVGNSSNGRQTHTFATISVVPSESSSSNV
ncbi:hypothetical protein BDZ89DRAFT_1035087 [Hymenopellis radicata]|nr:hypothetical protein BDZ89DRAFT_1035087 [Hymenopellis radicata]